MTDRLEYLPDDADLWAHWYGFPDAEALRAWGREAERDRLTKSTSDTDAVDQQCVSAKSVVHASPDDTEGTA